MKPVEVVPEQVPVLAVQKLNPNTPMVNSNYVFTPEVKKKIIEELPKMDLTSCKWGGGNGNTSHAILFNIRAINEAAQKLQAMNNSKILRLTILTSNTAEQSNKDRILQEIAKIFAPYNLASHPNDAHPEGSNQGIEKDYKWFKNNVAPYLKVKYVEDLQTTPGSPYISYEYDFE